MIIIDYSGIVIAGVFVLQKEIKGKKIDDAIGLVRHIVLSSILSHKKKHSAKFGEVVIACDGRNYWRKKYFPYYKWSRGAGRAESDLDWDMIFQCMDIIRQELIKFTPYKVIQLEGCEADDIIAILTKKARIGVFGTTEPVMIISSDNDMSQLQKYDKVEQYSPSTKKMIKKSIKEVKEYLNECTVKGQKKDGIPSIYMADDWFTKPNGRAKAIYQNRLDEFLEKGIEACVNDEERRNYTRNQTLMNFDYIPADIEELILTEYAKPRETKFDRMKLWTYLAGKRCNNLIASVEDF